MMFITFLLLIRLNRSTVKSLEIRKERIKAKPSRKRTCGILLASALSNRSHRPGGPPRIRLPAATGSSRHGPSWPRTWAVWRRPQFGSSEALDDWTSTCGAVEQSHSASPPQLGHQQGPEGGTCGFLLRSPLYHLKDEVSGIEKSSHPIKSSNFTSRFHWYWFSLPADSLHILLDLRFEVLRCCCSSCATSVLFSAIATSTGEASAAFFDVASAPIASSRRQASNACSGSSATTAASSGVTAPCAADSSEQRDTRWRKQGRLARWAATVTNGKQPSDSSRRQPTDERNSTTCIEIVSRNLQLTCSEYH